MWKSQPIHRLPNPRAIIIDKLLLEPLGLAAMVRVTGVSKRSVQSYLYQKYYLTPKPVELLSKPWQVDFTARSDRVIRGQQALSTMDLAGNGSRKPSEYWGVGR